MNIRVFWNTRFYDCPDMESVRYKFTPEEIRESIISVIYHSTIIGTLDSEKIASEIEFMEYEDNDKTGLELANLINQGSNPHNKGAIV